MTLKTAEQVCARLQLDTHLAQEFQNIISSQRSKRRSKSQPIQVSTEDFQKLSGWHFFAVLALIDKIDMTPHPSTLSEKLGIPKDQVEEALSTLKEVGFICENDGHYSFKTSTRDLSGRNDFYEINIQIIPEK
ncbi:DUF4423 domain-containing protein [Bdellovibrio sp. HCB337]|uniref:DUF4423 domain-containing protein n=1 Tax=Bdellovibrio sp. HCB337 TaxID=3394358 RepID=UPI0039A4FA62